MAKQHITRELNFNHREVHQSRYNKPNEYLLMISQTVSEVEEILHDIDNGIAAERHLENCYPELE